MNFKTPAHFPFRQQDTMSADMLSSILKTTAMWLHSVRFTLLVVEHMSTALLGISPSGAKLNPLHLRLEV